MAAYRPPPWHEKPEGNISLTRGDNTDPSMTVVPYDREAIGPPSPSEKRRSRLIVALFG